MDFGQKEKTHVKEFQLLTMDQNLIKAFNNLSEAFLRYKKGGKPDIFSITKITQFFNDCGLFEMPTQKNIEARIQHNTDIKNLIPFTNFTYYTNDFIPVLCFDMTGLANEDPKLYKKLSESFAQSDMFIKNFYEIEHSLRGFFTNLDDLPDDGLDIYSFYEDDKAAAFYTYVRELKFYATKTELTDKEKIIERRAVQFYENLGLLDQLDAQEKIDSVYEIAQHTSFDASMNNHLPFTLNLQEMTEETEISVGLGLESDMFQKQVHKEDQPTSGDQAMAQIYKLIGFGSNLKK